MIKDIPVVQLIYKASSGSGKRMRHEQAVRRGRDGSMHLCEVKKGFIGTNAIVAAHIPSLCRTRVLEYY
jgi:TPP-dependent pyruvate/acetoin dehydrogenase alpha subunit